MREVSGKASQFLIEVLEQRGIPAERLVDGLPERLEELRESGRRWDWDQHVRLVERMEELVGTSGLEAIGSEGLRTPHLGPARKLAGFMVRPHEIYRMLAHWLGPMYFRHLRFRCEELDGGELHVSIEIPESHSPCEGYFRINRGVLRRIPILLGMEQEAEVAMELRADGRRADFIVRPPRGRSLWGALRKLFGVSHVASHAVEELARQQRDLNRGLEELDAAQRNLGDQLQTFDALGQTLVAEIESHRLGERLLEALRERFGWKGAALWVSDPSGGALQLVCACGAVAGRPSSHDLNAGGRAAGRLDVWGDEKGSGDPAARELLERMLPWVAMAVANAHAERSAQPDEGLEPFRWSGEGSTELFLIVDADGLVRYAGPGVVQILGLAQDDVMQSEIVDLVHPDDLPGLAKTFTSFGDAPGSATLSGARVRHTDGSWRVLEGVGIKVQDEHDRPVYMFSASDVTFRQRAH